MLTTGLSWLAVALILRVLFSILSNYPDYFPPNFDSLFLEGRDSDFHGLYRAAFYLHILTAPFVLPSGLVLLSESFRRRRGRWHAWLGRVHVAILLLLVLPSGVIMSRQSFGGWPAGLSFLLLSIITASCTIAGTVAARQRRYHSHRRWMIRSYLLICSAVALRLISGAAGLLGTVHPESAYIVAAWCSWLVPLAGYELLERLGRIPPPSSAQAK